MLRLAGISKTFPGVRALDKIDFELSRGEVHVLFGENGAGKSSLINVISGMLPPDDGFMELDGERVTEFNPQRARALGIAAVFQEFSLVPSLSVLDNLFLGRELTRGGALNRREMAKRGRVVLNDLGYDIDINAEVGRLSRAHRQMVEIAKALLIDARVLILDEPTASLTDSEADHLLGVVRRLRARDVGIIYVSHRMREIHAIADRITVLRSGSKVGTIKAGEISEVVLVEMMTGRRIDALFPKIHHRPGGACLSLTGLTTVSGRVRDVSLSVNAGEVVGIAGLVGCGKGEVGRAVFGLEPIRSGDVVLDDLRLEPKTPRGMLRNGVCYFPSDRGAEGLALNRSVQENATMAALDLPRFSSGGVLRGKSERMASLDAMKRLALRPLALDVAVQTLSGGNRQKVMLARGILRDVRLYIFDEPTVGIDVGAKIEVYQMISQLVEQGAAVLLISSELSEVLNLSNRVYVMHEGRVVASLEGEAKTEANILEGFFGRKATASGSPNQERPL
jgi:ribose transport system ATP-binding protein